MKKATLTNQIPKMKVCRICKDKFTPNRPLQVLCSVKCSYKYVEILQDKKRKAEKAEGYEKLKTHSDYSKELQIEINTIARLIDEGVPCISSLRDGGKRDGGHRFSCGANPNIRFNLLNIYSQTAEQNRFKSGNPDGFDRGISIMYGDEYLKEVHELKLKYPTLKLSIPELISAKVIAKKIVRHLKLDNKTYSALERIELRKKFNNMIGICK